MLPRLYIKDDLGDDGLVVLGDEQTHYLKNVLRRSIGDEIGMFNGRDGEWLGRIEIFGRKGATLRLTNQRRPQVPGPDVWLAFAPIKRARIDMIAEKATELGVSVLWPVFTRRADPMRVNQERLTNIAIEAAEQTERLDIPEIRAAMPLEHLISNWPEGRVLFVCAEAGEASPIADAIRLYHGREAGFLIGPEGGFTAMELDALCKLPFVVAIGLGPRLLRAETAAIMALSCWQALAGDGVDAGSRPPFRRDSKS